MKAIDVGSIVDKSSDSATARENGERYLLLEATEDERIILESIIISRLLVIA